VSAGGGNGVWISLEGRQHLRVCRSEITGVTSNHIVAAVVVAVKKCLYGIIKSLCASASVSSVVTALYKSYYYYYYYIIRPHLNK